VLAGRPGRCWVFGFGTEDAKALSADTKTETYRLPVVLDVLGGIVSGAAADGDPAIVIRLFSTSMARFCTSILSTELIGSVPLVFNQPPPLSTPLTVADEDDNGAPPWTVLPPPPFPPPPPPHRTAFRCPLVPVHGYTQPLPSCVPSLHLNSPSTGTRSVICPGPHGQSRLSANLRIHSNRPWRVTCVSGMPVT